MAFQEIFGPKPKDLNWCGVINFTLAVYLDCKWHQYKYSIVIAEEDEQAVWKSIVPETAKPKKPKADGPPEAPGEKPADGQAEKPPEPPPEEEKVKKKKGFIKGPPPPPKYSMVDDFCFYTATRIMPTSARIKILDPLRSPPNIIWAELTFLHWLQGYPPKVVFLRPSRVYKLYRFIDYSFWRPPPPQPWLNPKTCFPPEPVQLPKPCYPKPSK